VAGNFFAGELFVDKDKKAFAKLGFKRFSILSILSAIFTRKAREATAKAKVSLPCFLRQGTVSMLRIRIRGPVPFSDPWILIRDEKNPEPGSEIRNLG
jgi:hypothetical protein